MSDPSLDLENALGQILCVLDCQEEALHDEALDLAIRLAHALGWQLRAGVSVDENLVRTATLSFLSRTGLESGRSQRFDLDDLRNHLDTVVARLRRRLGTATQNRPIRWGIERAEQAPGGHAFPPGAVVWWRVPGPLTLLPVHSAAIAGRRAILLGFREISPDERTILDEAAKALGVTRMTQLEIPSAAERPEPDHLATALLPDAPGLLVVALPSPCEPEMARWVEDLQRRLRATVLILR